MEVRIRLEARKEHRIIRLQGWRMRRGDGGDTKQESNGGEGQEQQDG